MESRHPFHDLDPKYLDCGSLVDAETGEFIRPATAREALETLKARRNPPPLGGIFYSQGDDGTFAATVQKPDEMSGADWRLAIALKLRFDRRMMRNL